MNLYEFEGKQLWREYSIPVPEGVIISKAELGFSPVPKGWAGYVVKAQTLSGNRARQQLVVTVDTPERVQAASLSIFERGQYLPELEHVLIEQRTPFTKALYVSITYSTQTRTPQLLLSVRGGTGIEENTDGLRSYPIDPLVGLHEASIRQVGYASHLTPTEIKTLVPVIMKLWRCFQERDCTLAEINPLVLTEDGTWSALDAKVVLDDDAAFRHTTQHYVARNPLGRLPTSAELAAWQIDKDDHRGVAGSSYIDLDGDIAILASGGGAGLGSMDALIANGGKPANFTEYSGNPPRAKVRRLTEIVLSKPGLNGCWVVGATANFTDIFETLSGFLEGVRKTKPKPRYPFVIRRGGPRSTEAFALLRQAAKNEGYDFHLYGSETPMISTAKMIVDLVNVYRRHGHSS